MDKKRDYKLRRFLLWLDGFIGIGAYWGALMMFIDPSGTLWGMDAILPNMSTLPFADTFFTNFIFSGIMLIAVNGIGNTIAVIGLFRNQHYGIIFSLLSGLMLLCWLSIQWIIFEINPLTTMYTIFSIVQMTLSIILLKNDIIKRRGRHYRG